MANADPGHVRAQVQLVRLTRETGHARHARISVVSRFVLCAHENAAGPGRTGVRNQGDPLLWHPVGIRRHPSVGIRSCRKGRAEIRHVSSK